MLDAIRRLLEGPAARSTPAPAERAVSGPAAGAPERELRVAACALLLELAHADDEFSPAERRHIEEAIGRHFSLGPEAVGELMALADERRSGALDLHQFTSVIAREYDEGQRMVLAEVLWRVVYADGELKSHESYLMRKLGSLLELPPGYLADARKRAVPGPGGSP